MCSLSALDFDSLKNNLEKFILINHQLFLNASEIMSSKNCTRKNYERSDTIKWHPIFGYLKIKSSLTNYEILTHVLDQLKFLWSHKFISILFDVKYQVEESPNKTNFKVFIREFFDKIVNKQSNLLNSPESMSVYRICSFYRQFLLLIHEPRIEILSGILTFVAF